MVNRLVQSDDDTVRSKIVDRLNKECTCFFDNENQEWWKCTYCEARDYILFLTDTMLNMGCQHCNDEIGGLLK